jgi:hypothetical protein
VSQHQALIERLRGAKPVEDRDPFIADGKHKLALAEYFIFNSLKHGQAIGARFVVVESTNPAHAVGSTCFQGWYINKAPNFIGDSQEIDRAADFVAKLNGCSLPEAGGEVQKLLDRAEMQPARGMVVACVGTSNPGRTKKDGTVGKPFTDRSWTTIQQGPAEVAAMRGWLDQVSPLRAHAAPVAPPAPAPQYAQPAPAPAPHPPPAAAPAAPAPQYAQPPYGAPPAPQYPPATQGPPPGYYPAPAAPAPQGPPAGPPPPYGYPGLPPGVR